MTTHSNHLSNEAVREPLPRTAFLSATGIGARAPHFEALIQKKPAIGWLEVHSENYFYTQSPPARYLEKMRADYSISLHGIGLSLGSASGLNTEHLARLCALEQRVQPFLMSEHLSFCENNGRYVPDLLPLPMTHEALSIMAQNVDAAQNALKRQILIENPSAYISFSEQDMSEPQFLAELVKKTGCGLLLDVNNIHVSAHNTGFDASVYLADFPTAAVQEIHLAGYQINRVDNVDVLIDAHNQAVHAPVWDLYIQALRKFGNIPTLIEWDNDIPDLDVLVAEAKKADAIKEKIFDEVRHVRTA